METRNPNESDFEPLHQDHYTVEDLAMLVAMDRHPIERAVFNGQLEARIAGHQILSIGREDAIASPRENR